MTIQETRIQPLNQHDPADGEYILYWMQQSQRAAFNPALEHAVRSANERGLPVVVGFGLMHDYPDANRRHYAFMLQGLAEVERTLQDRGIAFVIRRGAPDEVAIGLARNAAHVVCDRGYLRHQKAWREHVAKQAPCLVTQVEGDVVVPVEVASDKHETAARTLRPKLHRAWDDYLHPLDETAPEHDAGKLDLTSDVDLSDLDKTLDGLELDAAVAPVRRFEGGTSIARERLESFLQSDLDGYADGRSEPGTFQCSLLSPYLHFGQISPVEIALEVRAANSGGKNDRGSYLEELIVRRELSMNYVNFNQDYDRYESLPGWARHTLGAHRDDPREHRYSAAQLERAETHDVHWNTAMREMVHTGFMHNYMRMYWAKKILEWSNTPEHAFHTALALNNRYFLDGRDPNSYANVAWTFGLHDRPWPERPVFGKVRYMNAKGLERKFDMKSYRYAVDRLVDAETA
jgi:deoxyribodipyrimidine photo-lyase